MKKLLKLKLTLLFVVFGYVSFAQVPGGSSNAMVVSRNEIPIANLEDLEREKMEKRIEYGEFSDSRDGKTYKAMTIVLAAESGAEIKKTWMTQNLDYDIPGSFYYDNNPDFAEQYGRLYTIEAAKKACPEGWHLPTHDEWMLLATKFGGKRLAAGRLKHTGISGFDARFGGRRNLKKKFTAISNYGSYWGVKNSDSQTGLEYEFNASDQLVVVKPAQDPLYEYITEDVGLSCRCVKD
ncbi:FISUMP domain-containing protein [Flexithrix dorotheae]|uniref:FISUMP domain-containing protein n=1 Tax=Flexithrix dorotheae TaxID=70993 RepID=UPI000360BACD|nr:FISUMP domain-containing protein [Flexithrix dorotheae]